jgi:hypothetical protein
VPVTVTVRAHPPAGSGGDTGGPLPFTGFSADVITALGLAIGLLGAAISAAVRRRPLPSRARSDS